MPIYFYIGPAKASEKRTGTITHADVMYHKLEDTRKNVLGYRVSGKVTQAEVAEIQRDIKDAIGKWGTVRLLLQLGDLEMPEASAVWEDLKMLREYLNDVERYAVVGDENWQKWITEFTGRAAKGEAMFFRADELQQAWEWIHGPVTSESTP